MEGAAAGGDVEGGGCRPCVPPNTCGFWVPRKHRYCRLALASPRDALCPTHAAEARTGGAAGGEAASARRVPCPADPNHTVPERWLERHLKVCNAARAEAALRAQPHYDRGVNAGSDDDDDDEQDAQDVDAAAREARVVRLVREAAERCLAAPLEREDRRTPECSAALERLRIASERCDTSTPFSAKHAAQQASILSWLHSEAPHLLGPPPPDDVLFAELGAGRGYLAGFVAEAYGDADILLAEIRHYRFKVERSLRKRENGTATRMRIDVADLALERAECCREKRVVVVGKHLCGCCTDFALRAARRLNACPERGASLGGIAIATCCHHACTWRAYVNKPWLRLLGFSKRDFPALIKVATWGTNGFGHGPAADDTAARAPVDPEKTEVGRLAKRLLDTGRALWLQGAGGCPGARVVEYVDEAVSPENRLLLATTCTTPPSS